MSTCDINTQGMRLQSWMFIYIHQSKLKRCFWHVIQKHKKTQYKSNKRKLLNIHMPCWQQDFTDITCYVFKCKAAEKVSPCIVYPALTCCLVNISMDFYIQHYCNTVDYLHIFTTLNSFQIALCRSASCTFCFFQVGVILQRCSHYLYLQRFCHILLPAAEFHAALWYC